MRGLGVAVSLTLCLLATSCDEAKPSQQEPGSPEGIKVLADMERSVEEVNVCEAIRDAGAEGDLVDILGADSVELESDYAETEDAYTQRCEVIGEGARRGDAKMSVSFFQGTEFIRADSDDPVVFAGCRIAQKPPPADSVTFTAVRATCGRGLTVDIEPDSDAVVPPWTSGPDSKPSEHYVNLIHDVLVAISSQK